MGDINAMNDIGSTELHLAAGVDEGNAVNAVQKIQELISAGACVDAKDENGETPLHWAVAEGRIETARALISVGANVNARDDSGRTPLDYV